MNPITSLFLAAGLAAFAYTKLGRRAGYGNTQNVVVIVAVVFVLTWIVAYTTLQFVLHLG
ncbi:MAG: hypothetical protein ABIV43_01790 [Candidatus Saccharimonadales bacterium]